MASKNRRRQDTMAKPRAQSPAPEVPVGQVVTEEDQFYLEWVRESLKNNLVFLNDVLRQLVTLTTSLLGGSVVFLDEKIIDPRYKLWIIAAFFGGLIVSFVGMLPHTSKVNLQSPSDIKQHKEASTRYKRWFVMVSGVLVLAGFLLTGAGMFAKTYFNVHVTACKPVQAPPASTSDHSGHP